MKEIETLDDNTESGRLAMVSAFLGESAFWGQGIDDHVMVHAVAEDYKMLTESNLTSKGVTQILEAVVNRT